MEQKRLPIFAERFAKLRGEMTQGEFAGFLGISRPTVGFYENGGRLPDALVLRQIAEKCKVSADWLIGLSNESTTDVDIQNVSNYTGLTSSAIKALVKDKNRHPQIDVYNYLFDNDGLLRYITNYFADFTLSKLDMAPYKHIPCKPNSLYRHYEDVHFASVIRALQASRENFKAIYDSDKEFEEKAIFGYLLNHADFSQCRGIVGITFVEEDEHSDETHENYGDDFGFDYDAEAEKLALLIEADEKDKEEEFLAITEFLKLAEDEKKN